MAETSDIQVFSPARKRKIQWKEIIIVTTVEEAQQFIDSLNDMSRRVIKADYELYYCKFSRTMCDEVSKYQDPSQVFLFNKNLKTFTMN